LKLTLVDRGASVAAVSALLMGLRPSAVGNIILVMVIAGWPAIVILASHAKGFGTRRATGRLYWPFVLSLVVAYIALPVSYAQYDPAADVPFVLFAVAMYQLLLLLIFLGLGARLPTRAWVSAATFAGLYALVGVVLVQVKGTTHGVVTAAFYGVVTVVACSAAQSLLQQSGPSDGHAATK
jgi:hypothetical protein